MIKLEVLEKDKYLYKLQDKEGNEYILNLEFFDLIDKPNVRDYIYLNSELLNPKYDGYSTNYTFGSLDNQYGKKNILKDDFDVIKIEMKNKKIYLKRLYG